jgi:hypothetical protein
MRNFIAIVLTLMAIGTVPTLALAQAYPGLTYNTGTAASQAYHGGR